MSHRRIHGRGFAVIGPARVVSVKSLFAYYYGNAMSATVVPVPTEHIYINRSFSVPRLSGWFMHNERITTDTIEVHGPDGALYPYSFFVICSQFDARQPPNGLDSCEMLVFRKGFMGRLINLRAVDRLFAMEAVNMYVFFLCLCDNTTYWCHL